MKHLKTLLVKLLEHLVGVWLWLRGNAAQDFLSVPTVDATQITPQLWTGGAISTQDDAQQLVAWGITADIDCREEFDDAGLLLINQPGIAYLWAGVADDGFPKDVSWFGTAWTFARPILAQGGVVLAHCAAGINRGPSVCYFLLRASTGMDSPSALALLKQKRPVVNVAYAPDADKAILALGLGK